MFACTPYSSCRYRFPGEGPTLAAQLSIPAVAIQRRSRETGLETLKEAEPSLETIASFWAWVSRSGLIDSNREGPGEKEASSGAPRQLSMIMPSTLPNSPITVGSP